MLAKPGQQCLSAPSTRCPGPPSTRCPGPPSTRCLGPPHPLSARDPCPLSTQDPPSTCCPGPPSTCCSVPPSACLILLSKDTWGLRPFCLLLSAIPLPWYTVYVQSRPGFNPWARKIPWRRKWHPTPVSLPGESYGQRSLVGYSPWGCKELDTTERLHFTMYSLEPDRHISDVLVLRRGERRIGWQKAGALESKSSSGPEKPAQRILLTLFPSPALLKKMLSFVRGHLGGRKRASIILYWRIKFRRRSLFRQRTKNLLFLVCLPHLSSWPGFCGALWWLRR